MVQQDIVAENQLKQNKLNETLKEVQQMASAQDPSRQQLEQQLQEQQEQLRKQHEDAEWVQLQHELDMAKQWEQLQLMQQEQQLQQQQLQRQQKQLHQKRQQQQQQLQQQQQQLQ